LRQDVDTEEEDQEGGTPADTADADGVGVEEGQDDGDEDDAEADLDAVDEFLGEVDAFPDIADDVPVPVFGPGQRAVGAVVGAGLEGVEQDDREGREEGQDENGDRGTTA